MVVEADTQLASGCPHSACSNRAAISAGRTEEELKTLPGGGEQRGEHYCGLDVMRLDTAEHTDEARLMATIAMLRHFGSLKYEIIIKLKRHSSRISGTHSALMKSERRPEWHLQQAAASSPAFDWPFL